MRVALRRLMLLTLLSDRLERRLIDFVLSFVSIVVNNLFPSFAFLFYFLSAIQYYEQQILLFSVVVIQRCFSFNYFSFRENIVPIAILD